MTTDKYKALEDQIKEAENAAREAREELERLKQEEKTAGEPWTPNETEKGWRIHGEGGVYPNRAYPMFFMKYIKQGRVFRTKEEAKKFAERERVLADMRRIAEKHGGAPTFGCTYYSVFYPPSAERWVTSSIKRFCPGTVRFPTDAAAQEAIDTLDLDIFLED